MRVCAADFHSHWGFFMKHWRLKCWKCWWRIHKFMCFLFSVVHQRPKQCGEVCCWFHHHHHHGSETVGESEKREITSLQTENCTPADSKSHHATLIEWWWKYGGVNTEEKERRGETGLGRLLESDWNLWWGYGAITGLMMSDVIQLYMDEAHETLIVLPPVFRSQLFIHVHTLWQKLLLM